MLSQCRSLRRKNKCVRHQINISLGFQCYSTIRHVFVRFREDDMWLTAIADDHDNNHRLNLPTIYFLIFTVTAWCKTIMHFHTVRHKRIIKIHKFCHKSSKHTKELRFHSYRFKRFSLFKFQSFADYVSCSRRLKLLLKNTWQLRCCSKNHTIITC
jgi:hypothetical protein